MLRKRYVDGYSVAAALLLLAMPAQAGLDDWLKERLKSSSHSLDADTAAAGLRAALEQGTGRAIATLGRENGFWLHPTLRIPVPEKLAKVENALRRLGQDKLVDEFVQSLNRAAEQATPAAQTIFVDAIRKMTIQDALGILRGAPDAATQFFRRHTETPLAAAFHPIVAHATQAVGVTAHYKRLAKKAEPLGLIDKRELDLDDYVTRKALEGLFQLVAEEEKRIRQDPVARTTELLRKVFR